MSPARHAEGKGPGSMNAKRCSPDQHLACLFSGVPPSLLFGEKANPDASLDPPLNRLGLPLEGVGLNNWSKMLREQNNLKVPSCFLSTSQKSLVQTRPCDLSVFQCWFMFSRISKRLASPFGQVRKGRGPHRFGSGPSQGGILGLPKSLRLFKASFKDNQEGFGSNHFLRGFALISRKVTYSASAIELLFSVFLFFAEGTRRS